MSTPREIRDELDKHPPHWRITSDEDTAIDRQWLRLLDHVFKNVSHAELVRWGLSSFEATEFLGIIALRYRLDEKD